MATMSRDTSEFGSAAHSDAGAPPVSNGHIMRDLFALDGAPVAIDEISKSSRTLIAKVSKDFAKLAALDQGERVAVINAIRAALCEYSPFKSEPVDFVKWVPADSVRTAASRN